MRSKRTTVTATSTKTDALINLADTVSATVRDIMRNIGNTEVLPRFQSLAAHEIIEKRPGDLVTAADHASELAFEAMLPGLIANSVVLGEEGYEADHGVLSVVGSDRPVWIVDPVDGTHNFAHGETPFTMIVALVQHGRTVAGWILDPITDELIWAIEGKGAHLDSPNHKTEKLTVPNVPFQQAFMTAGTKLRNRLVQAAVAETPRFRDRYRCVGREYMDIALGKLHLARYGGRLKPWDHAAGCLIVREAGGIANWVDADSPYTVTDSLPQHSVGIAATTSLWPQLRDLVQRADAKI